MKNILLAVCMLAAPASLLGQTEQGTWEFSVSGNFGVVSGSTEITDATGTTTLDQESQGYLAVALRPGFYVVDGLTVEPELLWTAVEKNPPCFSLSGNLAYNFDFLPSKVLGFVLAGYGRGNSIPLFERLFYRASEKLDISILNFGGGVKFMLGERVALRAEYRYQHYSQEQSVSALGVTTTMKTAQNYHNLFCGLSFFVR